MHSGARNPTGEPQDSQASSFQTSLDRKAHPRLAQSNNDSRPLGLEMMYPVLPESHFSLLSITLAVLSPALPGIALA